jgi:hypothetical protein
MGWPDRKEFQLEKNLPSVFLVDISEKGKHAVSQYATHRVVKNSDGTGQIIQEKLRLHTMLQMTLFAETKALRDQLGWQLKQYFVTNFRLPLNDYTQNPVVPTGEYVLLKFVGDRKEEKGEANCWKRDITFVVQSRVLDAVPAYVASNIVATETIVPNLDLMPHAKSPRYTATDTSSKDSSGNPITTVTMVKKEGD